MKKIMVFGTFDVLHPGHKWFLKNALEHGDYLIAVVSRDKFIQEWKKRSPVLNEQERINDLKKLGLADKVIPADPEMSTYGVIREYNPDIICLGHDQIELKNDLEKWLSANPAYKPQIIVLPPWKREKYSSTQRNRKLQR